MVKRGEIYLHSCYTYPAGNTADKLLIVLKETSSPKDPVIIIPTTTDDTGKNHKDGCSKRDLFYYLNAKKDFFEKNTIVQLHTLNGYEPIDQASFDLLIQRKIVEHKGTLSVSTLNDLMNCIKSKKDDVDMDIFSSIFS